jgi:SAM-dependent methyltransferase
MPDPSLADAFTRLRAGDIDEDAVYRTLAPVYCALYAARGRIDGQFDLVDGVTPSGGRVLELGCGTGDLLRRLCERYEAVGVDPSPEMCRLARARTGGAPVVVGTAGAVAPGAVDTVAALGTVLGHVRSRAAARETVDAVYDSLRSGGRFVCSVHARSGISDGPERGRPGTDGPVGPDPESTGPDPRFERELTVETDGYRIVQRDRREPGTDGTFTWRIRFRLDRLADGATVTTDQRVRLRAYDDTELRSLLTDAGFTVDSVRPREFVAGDAEEGRVLVTVARR